jgi:hypothetical protein
VDFSTLFIALILAGSFALLIQISKLEPDHGKNNKNKIRRRRKENRIAGLYTY